MPRIVEIDDRDFRTLDEFFDVIGAALVPGETLGKNLDAFNDLLCSPLAHDPEPYVLVWRRSNLSRRRLNYGEFVRYWEEKIVAAGKPDKWQIKQIARAERCQGPSAFDELVEIIRKHPDRLMLRLE